MFYNSSFMSKEHYIVGLDVGTSYVRAVQGKVSFNDTLEMTVIGASEVLSSGIRKGVIVDIEDTVSSITQALEKLERITGVPVYNVNVSVSGSHITTLSSHGVIAVSRPDGEIVEADIVRCIDASQAISVPQNKEILHVFPKSFILDGQSGIKDPLGMSGVRLEVDALIVQAGLPFVKNLTRAINQAGLEIGELVLAPLAAGEAVLSKRQKDLGVVVVDLGAGTTSLAVYEEGDLLYAGVIPVGFQHITNDLAIGLRTSVETAEKVKMMFGQADLKNIPKNEEINLSSIDETETESVLRSYVAEIIIARLEEIFDLVSKELKKIGRDGKLPSGVVLTGGGANLPGILEFTKKHLRLPVSVGSFSEITTVIDMLSSSSFATAVGLVLWGKKYGISSGNFIGNNSGLKYFKNIFSNPKIDVVKKWFKSFLP